MIPPGGAAGRTMGPTTMRATIRAVDLAAGTCLVRDTLGKERQVRLDMRPKGTGVPAVEEIWTITRVGGDSWTLGSMVGNPPPPEIEGELDPGSPLAAVLAGLVAQGLAVDATTTPAAPSWAALPLGAGWAAYTNPVGGIVPPGPSWTAPGGVLSLRGLLANADVSPAGSVLAVVPLAGRPERLKAGVLLPEISTSASGVVRVDVRPNGELMSPFELAAGRIVSLEQASWPTW